MSTGRVVYNAAYHQARRRYLRALLNAGFVTVPCSVCGYPVDLTKGGTERDSCTIDHTHPMSKGGALLDQDHWAVAHHGCNSRKGNRLPRTRAKPEPRASRQW